MQSANPGLFSNPCFQFQSLPPIQHAFFVGCVDSLALWVFFPCDLRFTKLPINIKPKVNFASTSVGKTQSGCLLSATGYQYAYRYILLSDLKQNSIYAISILYRYSQFSVDYWRNIESFECARFGSFTVIENCA